MGGFKLAGEEPNIITITKLKKNKRINYNILHFWIFYVIII